MNAEETFNNVYKKENQGFGLFIKVLGTVENVLDYFAKTG
jgi:hypothetical protein